MPPRRRAAVGLWAALTYSFAVLVHGAIHAAGSHAFVWDSPAHVAMLISALAALGAAGTRLAVAGPSHERRRRLALVRAALEPSSASTVALAAAGQIAIAAALLLAEGATIEPDRLVAAVVSGLVALACSLFVFRAARDRVIAALVALAAPLAAPLPRAGLRRRELPVARAGLCFRLFVPNRPPPAFAL